MSDVIRKDVIRKLPGEKRYIVINPGLSDKTAVKIVEAILDYVVGYIGTGMDGWRKNPKILLKRYENLPGMVHGILKNNSGLVHEPIMWQVRSYIKEILEREGFLGGECCSFDTFNLTPWSSHQVVNIHRDLATDKSEPENLQSFLQIQFKVDPDGNVVILKDEEIPKNAPGFTCYPNEAKGALKDVSPPKEWYVFPSETVENWEGKVIIPDGKRVIVFDGSLPHSAGTGNSKLPKNCFRLCVYAAFDKRPSENVIDKRIKLVSEGKSTGHSVQKPKVPSVRIYKGGEEAAKKIKDFYSDENKGKPLIYNKKRKLFEFNDNRSDYFKSKEKKVKLERRVNEMIGTIVVKRNIGG